METFRDAVGRLAEEEFVGRVRELAAFKERLRQNPGSGGILNVYGTGGIGKTELLTRFQAEAEQAGTLFKRVDLRETMGQTTLFLQTLTSLLGINREGAQAALDIRQLAEELNAAAAGGGKLVLALDQYEAAGSVDQWLREEFFPLLRADTILVIAGRHPLGGAWMLSSVWRKWILPLPLDGFTRDEVKCYLKRRGIVDEPRVDRLWLATAGHPLSLALLAEEEALKDVEGPYEWDVRSSFEELLQSWLQEVPGDTLRALVYAASVPRYFDLDLLQAMLGAPFTGEAFDGLLKLSFIRPAGRGWEMHELARSLISRSLRERQPDTYSDYRSRAAEVLSARIRAKAAGGNEAAKEVHELIGLTGNPIMRAHFRFNRNSKNYWEAAKPETVEEAKQYLERRRADCRPSRISCSDTETGCLFQYELTATQSLYRLEGWEPETLLALEEDALRLLRNPEGDVVGVAAMLSIRPDTAEYLLRNPVSGPYFRARPEELKGAIGHGKATARFVFAIDVFDPEQIELRSDTVNLMMEHIQAGTLLIASPPALPFYLDSHRSLGFTLVPDLPETHRFGSYTEAAVFRLDTRGRKWGAYLEQIADYRVSADSGGTADTPDAPDAGQPDRARFGFTPREWEVADALATGASNKEIAARLYISEAAVKKHINAMLQKTGFRNRTQIVMAVLKSASSG